MKISLISIVGALVIVFSNLCRAQDGFIDGVDLTTIKAPWSMRILENDLDLTQVDARDDASAYFMMASASTKLNVSVYIEPVGQCKTSQECRDYVLGLGNPAWGKYEQLTKGKIKDFSTFELYVPDFQGQPVKQWNIYAEYVSDGYWIDLHISKVNYAKEDHSLFEKVVNAVSFFAKTGVATSTFDAQLGKAQTVTKGWLGLWGSLKCKETYTALSPITRSDITEPLWIEYCNTFSKGMGANRSRSLIAATFARSLPAKTDRPLSVLAYQSSFANKPSAIELAALILEKDGSWAMTNYSLP